TLGDGADVNHRVAAGVVVTSCLVDDLVVADQHVVEQDFRLEIRRVGRQRRGANRRNVDSHITNGRGGRGVCGGRAANGGRSARGAEAGGVVDTGRQRALNGGANGRVELSRQAGAVDDGGGEVHVCVVRSGQRARGGRGARS